MKKKKDDDTTIIRSYYALSSITPKMYANKLCRAYS